MNTETKTGKAGNEEIPSASDSFLDTIRHFDLQLAMCAMAGEYPVCELVKITD